MNLRPTNGAYLALGATALLGALSFTRSRGSRGLTIDYLEGRSPSIRRPATGRIGRVTYEIPLRSTAFSVWIENVPTRWEEKEVQRYVDNLMTSKDPEDYEGQEGMGGYWRSSNLVDYVASAMRNTTPLEDLIVPEGTRVTGVYIEEPP